MLLMLTDMRDFDAWLAGFRPSIADYKYYVDFDKANEARKSNVKQCTNKPLIKSNKHLLMND